MRGGQPRRFAAGKNTTMNVFAHIQKGRLPSSYTCLYIPGVLPALILLFLLAAAFLDSCTRTEFPSFASDGDSGTSDVLTEITLKSTTGTSALDIFFFNNDSLRRLDSYQRIEVDNPSSVTGSSRSGSKLLVVLANASSDRYDWADINSYDALRSHVFLLEDEDPDYPVMSAECELEEGESRSCSLTLKPLMAMVELSSLTCDFSGKAYEGSTLDNVVVYLSNVVAGCTAMADESASMLNLGGLSESDINGLARPEMLLQEIDGSIDSNGSAPSLSFYCYPNTTEEDVLGSPFTRLVIEGSIDGETCYYPININRGSEGIGIERSVRYVLDVLLTKRGTSDPDTPVEAASVTCTLDVLGWTEKDEITIGF